MAGLLVVSGTTAVTSTTVTAIANIGKGSDLAGVAGGVAADTMVAHPRRVGYIATTLGYSPAPYPPGITEIIEAPAMPTTLSTNRDAIVLYPALRGDPAARAPEHSGGASGRFGHGPG
jgi:hypothetical protein